MKIVKTKKNQSRIELEAAEWQYLLDNYKRASDMELLVGLKALGCDITFGKLRQLKHENRLVKQKQVSWTDYQVQYLLDNYQTKGNVEIANHFGWPTKNKKGEKKVWKKMIQMGLKRNKKQQLQIRKNNPQSYPDGAIWWQECRGAKMIKVDGQIHFYARWVWENNHGPIPEGMAVNHKNDDQTDCRIWNLHLLDRSQMAKRYLAAATENLHDSWVVSTLTNKRPEMKKILKDHPELIELQRQRIINNRRIKELENEK